jgi:hypothetical protein
MTPRPFAGPPGNPRARLLRMQVLRGSLFVAAIQLVDRARPDLDRSSVGRAECHPLRHVPPASDHSWASSCFCSV